MRYCLLGHARFRLSTLGGLLPTGPADDGEVEDYAVTLQAAIAATTDVSLSGGKLTITDTGGDDTSDTLTISRLSSPDRIRVSDPNHSLGAGTGTIQVNAHAVECLLGQLSADA